MCVSAISFYAAGNKKESHELVARREIFVLAFVGKSGAFSPRAGALEFDRIESGKFLLEEAEECIVLDLPRVTQVAVSALNGIASVDTDKEEYMDCDPDGEVLYSPEYTYPNGSGAPMSISEKNDSEGEWEVIDLSTPDSRSSDMDIN